MDQDPIQIRNQGPSLPLYQVLTALIGFTILHQYSHKIPLIIAGNEQIQNARQEYYSKTDDRSVTRIWITGLIIAIVFTFVPFLFNDTSPSLRNITYNLFAVSVCFLNWLPIRVLSLLALGSYYTGHLNEGYIYISRLPAWWLIFLSLVAFRFTKILVHTISYYLLYHPVPLPADPQLLPSDVTVIIPTVGEFDHEFVECCHSILYNQPRGLIISTVGEEKLQQATNICAKITTELGLSTSRIRCVAAEKPSKRTQIVTAFAHVKTRVVALADDHVFWPTTLIQSVLANFEDPSVGHVGTVKRVRREHPPWPHQFSLPGLWTFLNEDFRNYIAVLYLERHNFEATASSAIDGGLFAISGRTAFLRSSIVTDPTFINAFTNEMWGSKGPMNVDDDNFITRYMWKNGFRTVFHNTPAACMETTLGTSDGWEKFNGQLLRWARTTWRSNYTALFTDRVVWQSQPWSTLFVYIGAFLNLALFYDFLLLYSLRNSPLPYSTEQNLNKVVFFIFVSKMVKPLPHWCREPMDLMYLVPGVLFAYYHSLVKVWTLLTVNDIAWGTRKGVDEAGEGGARPESPLNRPARELAVPQSSRAAGSGSLGYGNANGFAVDSDDRARQEEKKELLRLANRMRNVGSKAIEEAIRAERRARNIG